MTGKSSLGSTPTLPLHTIGMFLVEAAGVPVYIEHKESPLIPFQQSNAVQTRKFAIVEFGQTHSLQIESAKINGLVTAHFLPGGET